MSTLNDKFVQTFLRSIFRSGQLVPSARRLLDLGCGDGPYRRIYSSHTPFYVLADRDVRARCASVKLDAQSLPFRDGTFDVVLLTEVIEHVANAEMLLREICRVTSPNGWLLITWPFLFPMHDLPYDFVRFTEIGMEHLLNRCGFRTIHLRRRGDAFAVILQFSHQLVFTAMEGALQRVPLLQSILLPVFKVLDAIIGVLARIYVWFANRAPHMRPAKVGHNLRGPLGHLAHWTLGYCAVAEKIRQ